MFAVLQLYVCDFRLCLAYVKHHQRQSIRIKDRHRSSSVHQEANCVQSPDLFWILQLAIHHQASSHSTVRWLRIANSQRCGVIKAFGPRNMMSPSPSRCSPRSWSGIRKSRMATDDRGKRVRNGFHRQRTRVLSNNLAMFVCSGNSWSTWILHGFCGDFSYFRRNTHKWL